MKKLLLITLGLGIITTHLSAQTYDKVICGTEFSIAHRSDNKLAVWGFNGNGQLGTGATLTETSPQIISGSWIAIAAGGFHTVALSTDSTLWGTGLNSVGQLGFTTTSQSISSFQQASSSLKFRSVSAAFAHTLAIAADGTLWGSGNNATGQLGDGTTANLNVLTQVSTSTDWKTVCAGGGHTLAIKDDGTLWAWGYNGSGQLGDGTNVSSLSPTMAGTDNDWVAVSAGFEFSLALKADGTLWSWGFNGNGQLGRATSGQFDGAITQVGTDNDWAKIAAAASYGFAIKSNGTLWAWGYNGQGQLGMDNSTPADTPTQIGTDNNWAYIAGATGSVISSTVLGTHSAGLKANAQTICTAGSNYVGQLGDGTMSNTPQDFFDCNITTTVKSTAGKSEINIYPNPATDVLYIQHTGGAEPMKMTITDISGKVLSQQSLGNTATQQVHIGHLPAGSYFLLLTNDKGDMYRSRFVKQ